MLSETSQRKTNIYVITYMWNLKKKKKKGTNKLIYKTERRFTGIKNKLTVNKEASRGGIN